MNVEESSKLKEAALPDDDESCADNSCILLEKDLTTIEIDDTVEIVDSEEVEAGESRDEGEIFELNSSPEENLSGFQVIDQTVDSEESPNENGSSQETEVNGIVSPTV